MKLAALINPAFSTSLNTLMKQPKLPVATMFKLRGVAKVIREQVAKYNETKDQLVAEYSVKDDKQQPVKKQNEDGMIVVDLDSSRLQEFMKKMMELGDVEVVIPEVAFSELGDPAALTLTAEDLYQLEFVKE